jgi:S-adenosylmethionine/arginine decarboxylase-like enzyme
MTTTTTQTLRPAGGPRDLPGPTAIGEGGAWGLATAIDLHDCDPATIRSRVALETFVVRLCERLRVRRFGRCRVVRFGTGRVAGYSLVQLIETSLVSGHFVDETNAAFIDVFSCAPYDPAAVAAFAGEYFRGTVGAVSVTLRR